MARFIFILSFLLLATTGIGQLATLPLQKLDSCMRSAAKPVLILLTTDWCKYCELQKAQLKKNPDFQTSNERFYFAAFDAEEKGSVTFHGQTYAYKATGIATGLHELAVALSGDKSVSFPAWVLLSKDYEVLFRYNGVLSPQQLKDLLKAINDLQ
ncbi:thioredoxin family protein [Longitalea luteola]|uniref:thioredoxin family protein n=1 Tax=Longitalea luteola TaxID=2812563 RepID=UPI001A9593F1|nr:thioredoxin family protein [Longitalea luteola]